MWHLRSVERCPSSDTKWDIVCDLRSEIPVPVAVSQRSDAKTRGLYEPGPPGVLHHQPVNVISLGQWRSPMSPYVALKSRQRIPLRDQAVRTCTCALPRHPAKWIKLFRLEAEENLERYKD